nr:MAG TPA: Methyltransferase domain [Caudoviricetes sp.]
MKPVLDVCCGARMWWHDKTDARAVFMDCRELETTLCDGRSFKVLPDVLGDFRRIPFEDETFNLVAFDPPHLRKAGDSSWLAKKYGVLGQNWQSDLRKGFSECFRVLKPFGTLVFKWNEGQIKLAEILKLTDEKPLFMHKRQKTHFVIFLKGGEK